MTTYTKEQLAEMAGEHAYKKPKIEPLNKITFNGETGKFIYTHMLGEKDAEGKYPKKEIGDSLQVVFLKIRRILSKYNKKEPSLTTSEHNTPDDMVMLFGKNEKGTARQLREKYPELRTQQIVYAYLPKRDEVVRLTVKGSSLGSDNKPKGVLGFYEYLATFGKDEHIFDFHTNLSASKEEGELGEYYSIKFEKGERLPENLLEKAIEKLGAIHEVIKSFDEYYKVSDASKITEDSEQQAEKVEYPSDDVNPDDIPF